MTVYEDPIIKAYSLLIKDKCPAIKVIYQGDPIVIPTSFLPAVCISKVDTQIGDFTNMEDKHTVRMMITVVTDIRREINNNTTLVPGIAQLYELIEGRNPETYKLQTSAILDILRANKNVSSNNNLWTDLESVSVSSYSTLLGKRDVEAYSVEAQITFNAYFTQLSKPSI